MEDMTGCCSKLVSKLTIGPNSTMQLEHFDPKNLGRPNPDQKCWQHSCRDFFTQMLPTLLVRGYRLRNWWKRGRWGHFYGSIAMSVPDQEVRVSRCRVLKYRLESMVVSLTQIKVLLAIKPGVFSWLISCGRFLTSGLLPKGRAITYFWFVAGDD